MTVEIIDCTLRDGGYVNQWKFTDKQVKTIVSSLNKVKITNIECGYLSSKDSSFNNSTRFSNIESLNNILMPIKNELIANLLVMIDFQDYNTETLSQKTDENLVSGIRLAFHKKDYLNILDIAQQIINKGYKLYLQPMQTSGYSNDELISLIEIANKLNPEALYIVDSFGNIYPQQLENIFNLFNKHLNKNIKIGFHAHNNLQMAFANSVYLINLNNSKDVLEKRNLIIDSSLGGIARGGGNLNTEIITAYLNQLKDTYNLSEIFDLLENHITEIFSEHYTTNNMPYVLSAMKGCHPSYPKYFQQNNLNLKQINKLIDLIDTNYLGYFDLKYASILLHHV